MTLDQLLALDAIVATGTFRAAADRLNKAQSAVSHQIRKLEDEIQTALFSRDSYRPQLTPEGSIFYRETVRVLDAMRALQATARDLGSEQEPLVRMAMTATMPVDPILRTIGAVGAKYPDTQIRLDAEMMGGPLARLMEDEADIIFSGLDGVPVDQVETLPVCSIIIRPVAHRSLPPARTPGAKSRQQMQAYVQVVVSDTGGGNFAQSRDLLAGGQRWNVTDFATKKAIILAGLGWGGMPEHMIVEELESGELVPLSVDDFPPRHTEIFAIRRRDKALGRVASDIWTVLRDMKD